VVRIEAVMDEKQLKRKKRKEKLRDFIYKKFQKKMEKRGLDPSDMNKLIPNGDLLNDDDEHDSGSNKGKNESQIVHDLLYDGVEESEYQKAPKYYLPGITPHAPLKPIQKKYYVNFIKQLFAKDIPLDILKEWYEMPLHPLIGHVRCTIKRKRDVNNTNNQKGLINMLGGGMSTKSVNTGGQTFILYLDDKMPHGKKHMLLARKEGASKYKYKIKINH